MSTNRIMRCEPCTEYQRYTNRIDSNGIYVTGLPSNVQELDLIRFFSSFGHVADFFLSDSRSFCLVHFENREPVHELIQYPVGFMGRYLSIRPRSKSKTDNDQKDSQSLLALHEEVLNRVSMVGTFEDQVQNFIKIVAADETVMKRHQEVYRDLEKVLSPLSSVCKIMPFGSSLNGLALKDSDLDIYYGTESLSTGPGSNERFRKVRMVIEKANFIRSFRPIANTRVPIIKFIHKSTDTSCDLSFRNAMGVQNSKLVKFLMSLDDRIKPFFMVVRFWAKLHHLTGKRMSNYALIMLLVNFLQSLNDPILPPLTELQRNIVNVKRIDGWNVSFNDDITRIRPVSNNLPLEELLVRFFESVVKTDFKNYVVSPFAGSLILKHAFDNISRLPPELRDYVHCITAGAPSLKTDTVLCIQDPFEQNFNITKNIAKHDFQCFQEHCEVAAKLNFSVPPHLYLSSLLSNSYVYPRSNVKKSWLPNPLYISPPRPYLTIHVPNPENGIDEIVWRSKLTEKITLIFKKVLKLCVENTRKGSDIKPGLDQDFSCKGSQVLWVGRDKLSPQWFSKATVPVLDLTEDKERENRGEKRKRTDTLERARKEMVVEKSTTSREVGNVDTITIDSDEETERTTSARRSIQDEIALTNFMVRREHALPASQFILDFRCSIGNGRNGAIIEISDHRSRRNYFLSLCVFLEDFLSYHVISEGSGS